MAFRVQEAASHRLDEIYRYTRDRSGSEQANSYITGLFEAFDKIDTHGVASKPVPAEFGVEGYFFRCERHFVYWRRLSNGDVGITRWTGSARIPARRRVQYFAGGSLAGKLSSEAWSTSVQRLGGFSMASGPASRTFFGFGGGAGFFGGWICFSMSYLLSWRETRGLEQRLPAHIFARRRKNLTLP
jgi:plasmid stabilization system protein ParE